MPSPISTIQQKITSEDVGVLKQFLEFAHRCLRQENERGKAAETRATVMLGILGVIATLVIPGAENLPANSKLGDASWLLLACYVSCLLFLAKALFYAIRTIGISKKYRLEPQMVFGLQDADQIEALRSEIAGIVWEYDQSIESNSGRLFWLHRCQRSTCIAIVILILFGFLSMEMLRHSIVLSAYLSIGLGVLSVVALLFLDHVAERMQGIWRK